MLIFDTPPTPQCHASTVVETEPGKFVAAWFGGKAEKAKDVQIWLSRFDGTAWSKPEVVGSEPGQPCWNPVLFVVLGRGLTLWYKAGPDPETWTGFVRDSADGGKTWSKPITLPAGFYGPVRAKPIELANGTLLAPTSVESYRNWTPYVDRSTDCANTWVRSQPCFAGWDSPNQIQPTLLAPREDMVVALMRSRKPRKICRSVSKDGGVTFDFADPIDVPNPSAGIDAVMVGETAWLVYNNSPLLRTPLSLARSTDDGKTWTHAFDLETAVGEFSYPAMVLTSAGHLAITYTWHRTHIKFVRFDPKTGKLV